MILSVQKSKLKCISSMQVPPSKSLSMRSLILASFAEGKSEISNLLISDDTKTAISVLESFGVKFEITIRTKSSANVIVEPPKYGVKTFLEKQSSLKIDVANSGSLLYFLGSLLSFISCSFILTGDESVLKRPVFPLIEIYKSLGLNYKFLAEENMLPIMVSGKHLTEEKTLYLDGSFSQVISGLFLACTLLDCPLKINLKKAGELPYLKMSIFKLKSCGIEIRASSDFKNFEIFPFQKLKAFSHTISSDWSSAAFPIAAAIITNSYLKISDIDINDLQGDSYIVEILKKMQADIFFDDKTKTININSLQLKTNILKNKKTIIQGGEFDCSDIPDAVPALSAVACFAEGKTVLKNIGICRFKECDRISVITSEFKKLGADIIEGDDFLIINGRSGEDLQGASVYSHKDHRIAMALTVIGLGIGAKCQEKPLSIFDADCFYISYPSFLDDLKNLNAKIQED